MTTTNKPFPLGTVSEGTLRTEDLLPAFLFTLESLSQEHGTKFNTELIGLGFGYSQCGVAFGPIEEWPIQEDEAQEIIEDIQNALQEFCPPFVYFGAHPGDGADFGFWPDMDALNEALRNTRSEFQADNLWILQDEGIQVHVNDHGNVTVMDLDRQILWECV